ncbi:MAG: hypothetical protein H6722_17800 [Sandaracinus sp.]|nr:hypothetical protein [Sandaracinus sp.]
MRPALARWYPGFLRSFAALAVLGVVALPSTASAYEDEVTLSIGTGYGVVLANPDLPTHGARLAVDVGIGLNDAWTLTPRVEWVFHPASEMLHVGIVGLETTYAFDILEIVPFFGLGLDGIGTLRDGAFGVDLAVHAVVGLDWLVTRDWLVGLDVRAYVLPFSLATNGIDPVYLTVGLHVGYGFERF